MRSKMVHQFSNVPEVQVPRSYFNRSFSVKTAIKTGGIYPFAVSLMYPGDTFNVTTSLFGRLATPQVPFMDNLYLDTFYFAVPMRLVWEHFENFMGEQTGPSDPKGPEDYMIPQANSGSDGYAVESIQDYMGIPIEVPNLSHSVLPLRAYNLIINDWFRAEYLQDELPVSVGDSDDEGVTYSIFKRGKRHDYFTSALPWPQKGAGVELPLNGNAPIIYPENNIGQGLWRDSVTDEILVGTAGNQTYDALFRTWGSSDLTRAENNELVISSSVNSPHGYNYDPQGTLVADLSNVAAATINSLRQAFAMQQFLERLAIGGSRYTEIVRSMFGVVSPDARLQRPEFLGSGSTRININPVQQTSASQVGGTPQGNLAAYGVVADTRHGFTYSATEHCIILALVNVRSDLTYQRGLWREWDYKTREDFYWPQFAHLGEQGIKNKEIFAQGSEVTNELGIVDEQYFGYQERYAECRYAPSLITGKMRSKVKDDDSWQSLDNWHLAQDFAELPVLNNSFIQENIPIDRVISVSEAEEPSLLLDIYVDFKCARPMPVYGTPGLTRM